MICFEGEHLATFIGTYYSFSGEESDRKICVNVTREEGDVNRFDFESLKYVVSEVATPIFGGATAAGEFASRIIVSRYLSHNVYYPDVRITVFVHMIRNMYAIILGIGELNCKWPCKSLMATCYNIYILPTRHMYGGMVYIRIGSVLQCMFIGNKNMT